MKKKTPISADVESAFKLIEPYEAQNGRITANFKLDTYPNQIEIINCEQVSAAI